MRSDFVSTVTHELKTPLATIRSVGEMLVRDRVKTPQDLKKYARILVQEENRLSRLVNNLLAYARVTDVADVYSFQPQDPAELVAEAILGFRRQLADGDYQLDVDVPAESARDPSRSNGDGAGPRQSDRQRDPLFGGAAARVGERQPRGRRGALHVADCGVGIPADELSQVRRRFVRGRGAKGSGSGLGLAIVSRIAADHGGRLHITSEVGVGTKVTLIHPDARQLRYAPSAS